MAARTHVHARHVSGPAGSWFAFTIVAVFLVSAVFLGGSSRADSALLLILNPLTVVALVTLLLWGIWTGSSDHRAVAMPLALLGATAAIIAIQLVPLPPGLLPPFPKSAAIDQSLLPSTAWRPISVAPDFTWASLIGLTVPLTMLVGYSLLTESQRSRLLAVLLALGAMCAILAVFQAATNGSAALYLHDVTSPGVAVGILANRNHSAVLMALTLPFLRAWTLQPGLKRDERRTRMLLAAGGGLLLIAAVLLSGSRSGSAAMLVALLSALLLVDPQSVRRYSKRSFAIGGLVVAMLIAVVLVAGRAISVKRLLGMDTLSDDRFRNLPIVLDIARDGFPLGYGFGSFDRVFRSYEPDAILKLNYFNNAHNDLVELVITGGLPALLLLIVFILWYMRTTIRVFRGPDSAALPRAAAVAIFILLAQSLVEYPLRTPALAAVLALCCGWLATGEKRRGEKARG